MISFLAICCSESTQKRAGMGIPTRKGNEKCDWNTESIGGVP